MVKQAKIEVGTKVVFNGYQEGAPEHGELLEPGQTYTIVQINDAQGEPGKMDSYNVGPFTVDNPKYDSKKRKSKLNQPQEEVFVDIFADEFTVVADKSTRTKAKAKPVAPKVEEEVEEESDEAEVPFDSVNVGEVVAVTDEEGTVEGEVFKKTKTVLGIVMGDEEIVFKKSEIISIHAGDSEVEGEIEEEEQEEEEEAPPPAPKAKAKAKATAKSKAKTTAKSKAKTETQTSVTKSDKDSDEETDPDLKKIVVLTDEEDDEEILALIEESDDICGLAMDLAEDAATVDYKLAGVLYHVYVGKQYKELHDDYAGEKGFANYAEKELGVGYRKAMYLIKGYGAWNKLGRSSEEFTALGWTKASEIAKVANEDNIDALMEEAQTSSVSELKETIKESFSKVGADTREVVKKITFKFRLAEEAANIIVGYLEQAAKQLGEKDDAKVFESIISEWAAEHLEVSTVKAARSASTGKRTASTRAKRTTKAIA